MTPEDLARTHAAAFAPARGWSAKEFAALIADPAVVLATDGPAFALARVVAGEAEILTLATPPEARRRGHAQRALEAFHRAAQARNVSRALLEVARDNAAAQALYAAAGYAEIGRRRGYYRRAGGLSVDAIVMARDFGPNAGLT